ncbi:MAG: hypothetical protein CW338_03035 [Clostridiales bacterium]|nr:hypothetical protein [Clostridiales bacterium]
MKRIMKKMMKENRMTRKILCLLCVMALLLSVPACAADRNVVFTAQERTGCENTSRSYDAFYAAGECGVLIPGLKEDLVPQGITYLESEDWLIFAGYSSNKGEYSALICADASSGEIRKQVLLETVQGEPYTGHAGGVCVTEKDVYVSNAHKLYRLSLETLLALPERAVCPFEEEIGVPVNSSYCSYSDGILWVGEFEYSTDYRTDSSHKIKTGEGTFKAWTCGYYLDAEGGLGSTPRSGSDLIPDIILSTPEKIQGITVLNGSVYISRSYGRRASSSLMRFDGLLEKPADAAVTYGGREIPVWYLDKGNRSAIIVAPPMTESLCNMKGKVIVLFESAANTYRRVDNASENPMDRVFCLSGW